MSAPDDDTARLAAELRERIWSACVAPLLPATYDETAIERITAEVQRFVDEHVPPFEGFYDVQCDYDAKAMMLHVTTVDRSPVREFAITIEPEGSE